MKEKLFTCMVIATLIAWAIGFGVKITPDASASDGNVHSKTVFSAANTDAPSTSEVHRLDTYNPMSDDYSLQLTVSGTGTVSYVEFLASNNDTDFIPIYVVIDASTWTNRFFESYTTNSGPGSDGKGFVRFDPPPCSQFKIRVNRTGGASTVSAWLVIQ